jgi:ADP-ribose pyrophosphatase YjhB (NUDIX family)
MSPYYAALRHKLGPDLLLIPGVAAVIHNEAGEVLIQTRADGGHSLPGGAVEPGEPPAHAIIREVQEETGVIVRPTRLLGVFGGPGYLVRYPNGDQVAYVVSLFACEITGGTLACLDGESLALAFMPPAAIPPLHTEYPRHLLIPDATGGYF